MSTRRMKASRAMPDIDTVVDEEAASAKQTEAPAKQTNEHGEKQRNKLKAHIYQYVVIIILLVGIICVLIAQLLSVNRPSDDGAIIAAGFLESFGTAMCTTAIVSFVADKFLRDKTIAKIEGIIEERQDMFFRQTLKKETAFFNKTLKSSKQYGLMGFLDTMRIGDFLRSLQAGDIVHIQCTFLPGAVSWLHDYTAKKELQRVDFRFIQLNPKSLCAQLRSQEVHEATQELYIKNMEGFNATLKHLEDNSTNFHVQMHDGPLSFPSYLIVREGKPLRAVTSVYMRAGTVGGMFPHLEWEPVGDDKNEGFIMLLGEYLEWKWNHLCELNKEKALSPPRQLFAESKGLVGSSTAYPERRRSVSPISDPERRRSLSLISDPERRGSVSPISDPERRRSMSLISDSERRGSVSKLISDFETHP